MNSHFRRTRSVQGIAARAFPLVEALGSGSLHERLATPAVAPCVPCRRGAVGLRSRWRSRRVHPAQVRAGTERILHLPSCGVRCLPATGHRHRACRHAWARDHRARPVHDVRAGPLRGRSRRRAVHEAAHAGGCHARRHRRAASVPVRPLRPDPRTTFLAGDVDVTAFPPVSSYRWLVHGTTCFLSEEYVEPDATSRAGDPRDH